MSKILAALLLGASTPSAAAQDSESFDLRCLILTAQLRQSEDATVRQAGEGASYFFFGRVDARVPESELEDRMWQESQAMLHEDLQAILQACGNLMQERGRMLIDVGNRIQARERAGPPRR